MVADGVDPVVEKKRRKLRAHLDANVTFRAVAEEWLVKITREERAEVTLRKVRWLLDMVYPFLGELPLHGIEGTGSAGRAPQGGGDGPLRKRSAYAKRNQPRLSLRHRHGSSEA